MSNTTIKNISVPDEQKEIKGEIDYQSYGHWQTDMDAQNLVSILLKDQTADEVQESLDYYMEELAAVLMERERAHAEIKAAHKAITTQRPMGDKAEAARKYLRNLNLRFKSANAAIRMCSAMVHEAERIHNDRIGDTILNLPPVAPDAPMAWEV